LIAGISPSSIATRSGVSGSLTTLSIGLALPSSSNCPWAACAT
jgi:hypothetical protein